MKYLMKSKSFLENKTYLKTYEQNSDEPQIGDYVKIHFPNYWGEEYKELISFMNNNIGTIVKIYGKSGNYKAPPSRFFSRGKDDFNGQDDSITSILVQYYNIPRSLENKFNKDHLKSCDWKHVEAFAKTMEELELKLQMKKYNL